MRSVGGGVAHDLTVCVDILRANEAAHMAREYAEAVESSAVFYGVYTDAVGGSGVYSEWPEVERIVYDDNAERDGASYRACSSRAEAQEYPGEARPHGLRT